MIFISYNWDDDDDFKITNVASKISKEFGNEKVFFDKEKNKTGDLYWKNIKNGLKTCNYFIFFLSKKYIKSTSCITELTIALENFEQKNIQKILPILLEENVKITPLLKERIFYKYDNVENTSNEIIKSIKTKNFTGFINEKKFDVVIKKNNEFTNIWEVKAKSNIESVVICKISQKNFDKNIFSFSEGGIFWEGNTYFDDNLKIYLQTSEARSIKWSIYDSLHFKLDVKNVNEDFLVGFYNALGSKKNLKSYEFYNINGNLTKLS